MKKIVVSAINFTGGGPLSILKECLEYLSNELAGSYEIIALVNDKRFFEYRNITYYSFPKSKKSWLARLYYEYIYFYGFSKKLNPHLWLSLHDITPNVKSDMRAVYCHNASPFYVLSFKDVYLGGCKFTLFNYFYRYLYNINIKKNNFVIVQQDWFRKKMEQLIEKGKIIVAYPNIDLKKLISAVPDTENIIYYPALPRVFKNFEVICRAAEILIKQGIYNFQVVFTMLGTENRYAKYIYKHFKHINNVKFVGIQSRDRVFELMNRVSCVVFPSKLETWGLPITEAKLFMKPVILADLEYAHETLGTYDKAKYFNPDDPEQLAAIMKDVINKTVVYDKTKARDIAYPFAQNWKELFNILLKQEGKHPQDK